MQVGEDILDAVGSLAILSEHQGNYFPAGPTAEKRGERSLVIMRPKGVEIGKENVVTWAVGNKQRHRTVTGYDKQTQEIKYKIQADDHIVHSEVVAIPRIGAMAVMDRSSALHAPARPTLNRIRAFFRSIDDASFVYSFLSPGDLSSFLGELSLAEYSYTVRRINPSPPSVYAAAFDESMVKEGIAVNQGVVKPAPGSAMERNEGLFIEATSDLAGAGYGVIGAKGRTSSGKLAQIRKPKFSMDKNENLEQQEKEQPLRVFFDDEQSQEEIIASVVAELVRFYDSDDASDVPEVTA